MSGKLLVSDIMTNEIKSVYYYETIKSAAGKMVNGNVSFLLVTDEKDNQIGVITRKDVAFRVVRKAKNPEDILVSSIMSSPIATVNENVSVIDFARILGKKKYRRMLVEKNGKLVGIASISDIIKAVANDKI